jgi:transposase
MQTEASKKLYVGLDLHSSNVYCAIRDEDGKAVFRKRLSTDMDLILKTLDPYRSQMESIAVESTYNWYWLVDGLMEAKFPVRLANPARMDQYEGLKETDDKSDALWLAEMLRLNILPEGYIYPKEIRSVRDMLRRRLLIVRQRTQTVLSLESMITRCTGRQVGGNVLKTWTRQEVDGCFNDPYHRETAWILVQLIQRQVALANELEKAVVARVKLVGTYERLIGVPGIGQVLGITIMLETGPIGRFKSAGNYASYSRMVKSRALSNGKKKGENNRKNGNKYLSWAYIEAANFAQRYSEKAHQWFQHKAARTHRVVALKALGCKLAKAVYYVLRDEKDFDERMLFG